MHFTLETFSFFRAIAYYEFSWSDILIEVVENGTNVVRANGVNGFNQDDIVAFELSPGAYYLRISEPEAQFEELRSCSTFMLTVTTETVAESSSRINLAETCPYLFPPKKLNQIAFLSPMSDNSAHVAYDFRADVANKHWSTDFDLEVPSTFRALVPPHRMDIDIELLSLDEFGEKDSTVAKSNDYEEDSVYAALPPGSYRLRFKFLANYRKHLRFPSADECIHFSAEIAIAPTDKVMEEIESVHCPAVSSIPPKYSELVSTTIQRPLDFTPPSEINMKFALQVPSLFQAQVNYNFVAGGVYFTLKGTNIRSPFLSGKANRTYVSRIGKNSAFLDELLHPGSYELVIEDDTEYPQALKDTGGCATLLLDYAIEVGVAPDNYCDDADTIPEDLSSEDSRPYGGPQARDGTVRISGWHYVLPEENSFTYVLFNVEEPSFVRYWISAFDDETDIDFLLWQNANKGGILDVSSGVGVAESRLMKLEPQDEPYMLELYMYERVAPDCSYAAFEFAVETAAIAENRLSCPDVLPSPRLPPASLVFESGEFYDLFSDEFYITGDDVEAGQFGDVFATHRTHITVEGEFILYVSVGYDFVTTDFSMRLRDGTGSVIAESKSYAPYSSASFVDFESELDAYLEVGNYTLEVTEQIYGAHSDDGCHRFQFDLLGYSLDEPASPTPGGPSPPPQGGVVYQVYPPAGTALDPTLPLSLDVLFSEHIDREASGIPDNYDERLNWVKNNLVAYLVEASSLNKVTLTSSPLPKRTSSPSDLRIWLVARPTRSTWTPPSSSR
eukprot:TRINITY_DN4244_c0_g1_i1.p1 TRINITY_DN4244_c0_g1~~TRINITY_DN4244_c0_g1_i1.p1  ORF type:complete len:870 (+),score=227.72 TRINITY_DN4244_c0_g1_i1:253-2610(+)